MCVSGFRLSSSGGESVSFLNCVVAVFPLRALNFRYFQWFPDFGVVSGLLSAYSARGILTVSSAH